MAKHSSPSGVERNTVESIKDYDVAIIGGGMVGLSMALLLAKNGIASRIAIVETQAIEPSAQYSPSFDARSTAVSAGSIDILSHLGVWRAIEAYASPINRVKVTDKGHLGRTSFDKARNKGEPLGCVVENAYLGQVLVNAALQCDSIDFLAPAQLEQLKPRAGGYDLIFKDELGGARAPANCSATLLVLANGSDSDFAKQLGIGFDRHNYYQHAVVANIEHSLPHNGVAFERFSQDGPLALLPLLEHEAQYRSALVWTQPTNQIDEILGLSNDDFLSALQQQFGYDLGVFQKVGMRSNYSLNLVFAREQVRSSLVLLGNAAHFLHPVAGQGFNLALRDCVGLASSLASAKREGRPLGDLQNLQAYIATRQQDQWLTTELSHRFIEMFASKHPLKQIARNTGLLGLQKCPSLNRLFFQQMMGRGGRGVRI